MWRRCGSFIVKYHQSDTFTGARIVGFEVEAYSVKHTYEGNWNEKEPKLTSVPLRPDLQPMQAWSSEIVYTCAPQFFMYS